MDMLIHSYFVYKWSLYCNFSTFMSIYIHLAPLLFDERWGGSFACSFLPCLFFFFFFFFPSSFYWNFEFSTSQIILPLLIDNILMASGEIDLQHHKFWLSVEFLKVYSKNLQATILFVDFAKAFDSIHRGSR